MRTRIVSTAALSLSLLGLPLLARPAAAVVSEIELPRESPVGRVSQQVGLTEISVEYGSPAVHGRKIWGGLVPYDQLWSMGSYQATKVRFSRAVVIGDKPVPAGTYALFAIPGKAQWTLVFNRNAEQLGSGRDYRPDQDVARLKLKPRTAPHREHLAFAIPEFSDDGATLELSWDRLALSIPIRVDTTKEVLNSISALDNTWHAYANAARYMLETTKDYDAGLRYVDQSLALKQDWYNVWIKALLLAAKGSYKEARAAAEQALELGQNSGEALFPEAEIRKAAADWGNKSVAAR
jgi:tetratricopeptide (TPR) repeat protein